MCQLHIFSLSQSSCSSFPPHFTRVHLGLEQFKSLLELRPLLLGLFHLGKDQGQRTCDVLHMLLVGGLQFFPLLLGFSCLLPWDKPPRKKERKKQVILMPTTLGSVFSLIKPGLLISIFLSLMISFSYTAYSRLVSSETTGSRPWKAFSWAKKFCRKSTTCSWLQSNLSFFRESC